MRKFLTVVMFIVVLALCVGFFRGWFTMSAIEEPITNKLDVHFKVDPDKMKQDASAVGEKTKAVFGSEKSE